MPKTPLPIFFLDVRFCNTQESGRKVREQFNSLVILLTDNKLQVNVGIYTTFFNQISGVRSNVPKEWTFTDFSYGSLAGVFEVVCHTFDNSFNCDVIWSVPPPINYPTSLIKRGITTLPTKLGWLSLFWLANIAISCSIWIWVSSKVLVHGASYFCGCEALFAAVFFPLWPCNDFSALLRGLSLGPCHQSW